MYCCRYACCAFTGNLPFVRLFTFLQVDSQDFCALLYEKLVARGYKVFLDRRDAGALHDLPTIVAHSKCLVFVLSSGIFESRWCLLELAAAVRAKVKESLRLHAT